jgi:hypothetical protein
MSYYTSSDFLAIVLVMILIDLVLLIITRPIFRMQERVREKNVKVEETAKLQETTQDNIVEFNKLFVAANKELARGNTEGLKAGISLFVGALSHAGKYLEDQKKAIGYLYGALSRHERANTKGPFNQDLSGYGVFCWKEDLYERDEALRLAWPYIERINNELKAAGMGWYY